MAGVLPLASHNVQVANGDVDHVTMTVVHPKAEVTVLCGVHKRRAFMCVAYGVCVGVSVVCDKDK